MKTTHRDIGLENALQDALDGGSSVWAVGDTLSTGLGFPLTTSRRARSKRPIGSTSHWLEDNIIIL